MEEGEHEIAFCFNCKSGFSKVPCSCTRGLRSDIFGAVWACQSQRVQTLWTQADAAWGELRHRWIKRVGMRMLNNQFII